MQLLKITSLPIKYQYNVERARLQYNNDRGSFSATKKNGYFDMKARNVQMRIDSYEQRRSMGLKSPAAATSDEAQKGMQVAREAVARYVDMGNQMSNAHKGANIPDILWSRMQQDATGELTFVPVSPLDMSWEPAQLDINYTPATLNFDWRAAKNTIEFIPGKFTMNIVQYPKVEIEYIGGPIYAPPSADPNYVAPKH